MSPPLEGLALGIDIGGTKIAVGLVDEYGQLQHHRLMPTPAQEGPEAIRAQRFRNVR